MPTILGRDYEDSPWGATQFQMDLMNPFDLDLTWTAARMAYGSGIAYGGYAGISYLTGTPMPSMAVQSINRAYMSAGRARTTATLAVRAAPYVPFAAAAHSQVLPLAEGKPEKSLPGMVMTPILERWLGGFTFGPQG